MRAQGRVDAYAEQGHDRVRAELETGFFAALIPRLLAEGGGGRVLDLGCGDGLAARLAGERLTSYTGVDLHPPASLPSGETVGHDLRDGLGPVGGRPFDLYLATFGLASHLAPGQLRRLVRQIARHGQPGSLVAIEALGLHSLEWPGLWGTPPGRRRTIPYRMAADVAVHPWAPQELGELLAGEGIRPLRTIDRSVQAGPKAGAGGYWPGLPPLRDAMNELLGGRDSGEALSAPLPPLPAGPSARAHHALATRRRRVVRLHRAAPAALARAVWALEPRSGDGLGHGLTIIGRVA